MNAWRNGGAYEKISNYDEVCHFVIDCRSSPSGCGSNGNLTSAEAAQEPSLALLLSSGGRFPGHAPGLCPEGSGKTGLYAELLYRRGERPNTAVTDISLASGAGTLLVNLTSEDSGKRVADIAGG